MGLMIPKIEERQAFPLPLFWVSGPARRKFNMLNILNILNMGKEGPSTLAILITEDPTALQYWAEL